MIRRRPLLRTAVVAGTAGAVMGHNAAKRSAHEAQQDAEMAQMQQQVDMQQQQQQAAPPAYYAPPPPPPQIAPAAAPAVDPDAKFATLAKLKEMLDQGVLTQQEFDAEKAKVLHGQ